MPYDAQQFSNISETPLGKDLWKFLNEHDNLIRMETASFLSRPAVEPLAELLVERFGKEVKQDRMKQMIGHMVRQVMEGRGFALQAQNVVVRFGELFTRGSKYRKVK